MASVAGRRRLLLVALALALLVVGALLRAGDDGTGTATAADPPPTSALAEQSVEQSIEETTELSTFSDLPPVGVDELPPEAIDTLGLIASGGPYPFRRDDLIFENREGLLPDRARGHYREYTVITPGEDDRGARRIVAGEDGERYYTADHYASFREIVAGEG